MGKLALLLPRAHYTSVQKIHFHRNWWSSSMSKKKTIGFLIDKVAVTLGSKTTISSSWNFSANIFDIQWGQVCEPPHCSHFNFFPIFSKPKFHWTPWFWEMPFIVSKAKVRHTCQIAIPIISPEKSTFDGNVYLGLQPRPADFASEIIKHWRFTCGSPGYIFLIGRLLPKQKAFFFFSGI